MSYTTYLFIMTEAISQLTVWHVRACGKLPLPLRARAVMVVFGGTHDAGRWFRDAVIRSFACWSILWHREKPRCHSKRYLSKQAFRNAARRRIGAHRVGFCPTPFFSQSSQCGMTSFLCTPALIHWESAATYPHWSLRMFNRRVCNVCVCVFTSRWE